MFIGVSQLMIMKLFRDARGLARQYAKPGQRGACIMFLDEIDSIGMSRGGQGGNAMPMGGMMGMMGGTQGLNTLLNQMDSLTDLVEDRWSHKILRWFGLERGPVKNKPLIFVIGATNRPSVLDPALTRPGRLDRILEVHVPDAEGRIDIIGHYLSSKAHDPELSMELLVNDSMGWTPIMIKTIINEALIHAHQNGREFLTYKDWLDAADERALGLKQPIRVVEPDRPSRDRLPRGRARGRRPLPAAGAPHLEGDDHPPRPRAGLRPAAAARGADVAVRALDRDRRSWSSLAGHVVESQFLDKLSTGPSSDLMSGHARGRGLRRLAGDGPDQARHPDAAGSAPPIGPVLVGANELLDQLYEETERLLREKEPALHYLAQGAHRAGRADRRRSWRPCSPRSRARTRTCTGRSSARSCGSEPFGSRSRDDDEAEQGGKTEQEDVAADMPAARLPSAATGAAADDPGWGAPDGDRPVTATSSWVPAAAPPSAGMPQDIVPPWAVPPR